MGSRVGCATQAPLSEARPCVHSAAPRCRVCLFAPDHSESPPGCTSCNRRLTDMARIRVSEQLGMREEYVRDLLGEDTESPMRKDAAHLKSLIVSFLLSGGGWAPAYHCAPGRRAYDRSCFAVRFPARAIP